MTLHSRVLLLVTAFWLSSCEMPSFFQEHLQRATGLIKKKNQESAAAKAQRNGEILQEMIRVIWLDEPESAEMFGEWLNSLNEGASIEGIYNGLIHNQTYRRREQSSESANVEALKAFIEMMLDLQSDLSQSMDRGALEAGFRNLSVYGLKRILGDEALARLRRFRSPLDLSKWYGPWAAHMTRFNVDFGLKQRNLSEADFHEQWSMQASPGSLDWEVLNRVHRVLNTMNGRK